MTTPPSTVNVDRDVADMRQKEERSRIAAPPDPPHINCLVGVRSVAGVAMVSMVATVFAAKETRAEKITICPIQRQKKFQRQEDEQKRRQFEHCLS